MISKTNAHVAIVPTADHSDYEGYFVKILSGLAALVTAATDVVFGVITTGEPADGQDSIACSWGGFAGTVHVKLAASPGSVSDGTLLELTANGSVKASTGTAGTIIVAQALESGAANELIEAILIRPVSVPASIDDASVTAAKLAADAVTTAKILDANVTAAKLAADAVTTAKILDANVTAAKLAGAAATGPKIHAGAITPFAVTGADASGGAQDLAAVGAVAGLRIMFVLDQTDGTVLDKSLFTAATDKFVLASGNYAADVILIFTLPASA